MISKIQRFLNPCLIVMNLIFFIRIEQKLLRTLVKERESIQLLIKDDLIILYYKSIFKYFIANSNGTDFSKKNIQG